MRKALEEGWRDQELEWEGEEEEEEEEQRQEERKLLRARQGEEEEEVEEGEERRPWKQQQGLRWQSPRQPRPAHTWPESRPKAGRRRHAERGRRLEARAQEEEEDGGEEGCRPCF